MNNVSNIFMRVGRALVVALAIFAFSSCGGGDRFRIEGTVEGVATQNLRAVFFADDALRSVPSSVVDGKFVLEGRSPEPTIVSLYLGDKSLLGRVVIKNGQTVKGEFFRGEPMKQKLKGNKLSEQWSEWLQDNADAIASPNHADLNAKIREYASAHSESLLSTVLLVTLYDADLDPAGAARIYEMIDPKARGAILSEGFAQKAQSMHSRVKGGKVEPFKYFTLGDSATMFRPAGSRLTLLSFTSHMSGRDSITPMLRELSKRYPRKRLRVIDFTTATDTSQWRRLVERDSANWTAAWLPALLASPGIDSLGVTDIPYFIVVDSTGASLLRTRSVGEADKTVRRAL